MWFHVAEVFFLPSAGGPHWLQCVLWKGQRTASAREGPLQDHTEHWGSPGSHWCGGESAGFSSMLSTLYVVSPLFATRFAACTGGHLSIFYRDISLLNWYQIVCMGDLWWGVICVFPLNFTWLSYIHGKIFWRPCWWPWVKVTLPPKQ